ncbi:MAG: GAF domain-containing protein [Solirubrobacteraceae bacterium]
MTAPPDQDKLRRLLVVGTTLVAELDTETLLERILEEARALTGARYAALGVLDDERVELERFLTSGIEPASRLTIGNLPRGRGVLGVLIEDPRPLRLAYVGAHPKSYGFPLGHPVMNTFLGVPILIRGQAWGNLYLTEKEGSAEFTEADEEAAIALAHWAATAIENARLYETSERRRQQAERAVLGLQAAQDIATAIAGTGELDRVLELIVKRGRALVDARAVLIMLREGDDLVVAASAGDVADTVAGRLPVSASRSGSAMQRGRPERIADVASEDSERLGVSDATAALLVPIMHRGVGLGVLSAFDHGKHGAAFTAEAEQLLRTLASSAANAVVIHRGVEADRLRSAISASDAERRRWARALRDQTLQALGGLRVLLASAQRRNEAIANEPAIQQAIGDIELETDKLRAIINDLGPSLLDDLGLLPAIDILMERCRTQGLEIVNEVVLDDPDSLDPQLASTLYRLMQEALTNVAKHARASTVWVAAHIVGDNILIEVRDDGVGFDPDAQTSGFGLSAMRERVYLAQGTIEVQSGDTGTAIQVCLPMSCRTVDRSGADQVAS